MRKDCHTFLTLRATWRQGQQTTLRKTWSCWLRLQPPWPKRTCQYPGAEDIDT
ncbi:hypothetical protein DPMN_176512 [Dreissena polymorpha]|uniref:Uncharacterized protein n=1 Tax=Dreissena polymorpha TaxID=45954 RepID=A0A9D4II54_DREPO|nr:hypothetical protein DPMN_176512 [Dreissena polymorpha]